VVVVDRWSVVFLLVSHYKEKDLEFIEILKINSFCFEEDKAEVENGDKKENNIFCHLGPR
jgi:hypothetical protein